MVELFPQDKVVGIFRGFQEGGLEFHADLCLPYQAGLHNTPMHGQFMLVQLENPNEAVLGRITALSSEGRLTSSAGEQFSMRALREDRPVPEQLRQDYLNYKVNIRVLGVVRVHDDAVLFAPSHRRLPHVGSPVAFLSDDVLRHLVGHYDKGAKIGVFALGEYVFSAGDEEIQIHDWMQVRQPHAEIHFPVRNLVSKRSFIFARAGFGKSNLNKLLFSKLYATTPTVQKRGGRDIPVGTVLFDPDGEYFWPDDRGRPGLCDVPDLKDNIVVFTSRKAPSGYYGSFIAGGIKLDIRRLRPGDVVSIALSPEKQDQQNVRKLRGMNPSDWAELVDLVDSKGNNAELDRIQQLLRLDDDQRFEALAARSNMTSVVKMLHSKSSQLMDMLLEALSNGKLCIVDVSQLRGEASLILSGLILRRIFDHNQEEFTNAESKTIPTIAVVEEAQSVLNDRSSAAAPFIEWVKEGRKYDLGALLITQQPGSIPVDILSQGDNWFVFHLLSATDLQNVKKANAHFSDDILSALLNEPIEGQGVFWSSSSKRPYPISIRVSSFETLYQRFDSAYSGKAVSTYAAQLRERYSMSSSAVANGPSAESTDQTAPSDSTPEANPADSIDVFHVQKHQAIEALRGHSDFQKGIRQGGIPWGVVIGLLESALPETMHDRNKVAKGLVPEALNQIFGKLSWGTENRNTKGGTKTTLFIVKKNEAGESG